MSTRRARHSSKKTGRRTRRAAAGHSMSVESIRASFDKIDATAQTAIQSGKSDTDIAAIINNAWANHFHHGLNPSALKGLILHYRTLYRSNRTRKHRQRGGMAPIDWTMGQGTTVPVYGSFPVEMGATARTVGALDLDRYFENPISKSCDNTGYAPPKQTGGGIFDTIFNGHTPSTVPPNIAERAINQLVGSPHTYASSAPESRVWQYDTFTPQPFNPTGLSSISTMTPIYRA